MGVNSMETKIEGRVTSVVKGSLPGILVVTVTYGNERYVFDVPENIITFDEAEKVKIYIGKEKPEQRENRFCERMYVVTEKNADGGYVTLLSAYGLLLKAYTADGFVKSGKFSKMEQVFVCIERS